MKKFLSILLAMFILVSLSACGENTPKDDSKIDVYVLVETESGTVTHDEEGRIVRADYFNESVEEFTFTEDGRFSSMTYWIPDQEEPFRIQEYIYDDTLGTGTYVDTTYADTLYGGEPFREQWQYLYDKQGRLTQGNRGRIYQYTEDGKLASVTLGPNTVVNYEYDTQNRLAQIHLINTHADGTYQRETRYEYDEEGRITRMIRIDEGYESVIMEFVYEGNFATYNEDGKLIAKYEKVRMTPEQVINCLEQHPLNCRYPIYLSSEYVDPYWY